MQESAPSGPDDKTKISSEKNYNEAIFSLLVENIKDYAIFMIDTTGHVVSWNKGAEKIKGYSAREIIGKHISVFYRKEDIEDKQPDRNLQAACATGHFENDGWRIRKDGSLFWANVVFTALYDDGGSLKGFAKVTRDITQHKVAEDKLVYLANLLEKTSDAIFSYDDGLRLLSWNKAAESMYGYTFAEVLHKNAAEILRADIDENTRQQITADIEKSGTWTGEATHRRKDGSILHVYIALTITLDKANNAEQYVCICRDITAKKKAEADAQRMQAAIERLTQEKLNYSLKEVSDYKYALDKSCIVAITNQKGIIEYVNENFCTISKYSSEELIGQDHRIINSGHHSKEFIRNLWVTIAKGGVWKGEIKNKAKDGKFYWVDTTIVPFLNESGKPYQYVAIRADITERKNAEEELYQLNEQLEDRVKSRTHQFEIANRELEAFSYSVSHDLRAPLRGVSGFAKILEEDYGQLLDEEGNRLLHKINDNAGTMGQLIDDLLTFSRTGRKEIIGNIINMNALVDTCLRELLADNRITVCSLEKQQLAECTGDISLIKQVWLNLIGNAIKYSSKTTSPKITIGSIENDAMQVYFVKDNGVGFDMQYAHKLFGVFQRLHSNEEFDGTGVGLALVKLIISKHHGEVWAEAEPGKGAAFYFSLPKKIHL